MANLSNINNILRTGSLGVGINRDPLGAFEISSATKPGVKMFNTSTNGKTYEAYSDTNGNYIIYDQDADDNRFVINTSGNATFTGNVTANTGSKITSSSADTTFSIETTSGTTIFPILDFVSSHSSVGAKIRVSGTDVISLDKSQNATFAGNVTVSGTYLTLGGEGYIRSDDSGYLHFQGGTTGTRFFNNANNTALFTILNNGNATFAGTIQSDDITIVDGTNDINLYLANTSYGIQLDYSAGDMFFRTNGATRLTIANGGNVGIRTTSPQTNLHINNDTSNSYATLRLEGANRGGIIEMYNQTSYPVSSWTTDQSGNIFFATSGAFAATSLSTKFTILTGGNVGIGTTSPTSKLHLRDPGTNSDVGIKIGNDSRDWNLKVMGSVSDSLQFFTHDNSNVMTILPSGNVGIGTTNPGRGLTIDKSNEFASLEIIKNNTGNQIVYLGTGSSGASDLGILQLKDNNTIAVQLYAGGDSWLNGGNVGIGTTSPFSSAKLQVKTNTDRNVAIQTGTTHATGIKINAFNDAANTNIPLELNGSLLSLKTGETERMRITSTGAISVGSSGTAYGAAGEVLTSNGNASPSWQAAGGGGSAWPQEKFAEYTINSTTSNILVATMNSTTWHGNYLSGCLKFTMSTSDYVQVTYVPVSTFLSGSSKWFFKGTEMTSKNNGSNPAQLVFTFAGDLGTFGSTCTLKINRNQSISNYIKVNVLVQAISNPNMFILN